MRRRTPAFATLPPSSDDAAEASSLKRGLDILRALPPDGSPLTLTDVANQMGSSRATARRLLHTLAAQGFLRPVQGGEAFEPDLGCLKLGTAALSSIPELWHRQPVLQDASKRLGLDITIATLDGNQGLVVEHTSCDIQHLSLVGSVFALEHTPVGRCLLWKQAASRQAELIADIRERASSQSSGVLAALYQAFQSLETYRYCMANIEPGVLALAFPMPENARQPTLVLGCVGDQARLSDPVRLEDIRNQLASIADMIGSPTAR